MEKGNEAPRAQVAQAVGADLQTVECNFCGSSDYSLYDSLSEWRIVKCKQCGFCFTNPRPTPETIPSFYTLNYFKDAEKRPGLVNEDGSFKSGAEMDYRNRIIDIESHVRKRGSLLEIGSGPGGFLKVMQMRGWDVYGIELSSEAAELARVNEQVNVFCGSLEEYDANETYDVICMYQSLEHVPDPAYVIQRSYEMLNTDGIVVIEVPNLHGFDIKVDRVCRRMTYDLPVHLSHFTPRILSGKLKATGFKIIDVDLYVSKFILKLVERRKIIGASCSDGADNRALAGRSEMSFLNDGAPGMAGKTSNWKTRLFRLISKLLPGWRFTIVARK